MTEKTSTAAGASSAPRAGSVAEERTIKIASNLAGVLVAVMFACIIAIGFMLHPVAGLACVAFTCYVCAKTIAETIKEHREKTPNNLLDGLRPPNTKEAKP